MSQNRTMNDIKGKYVNIVLSVEEGRGFDSVKCPFFITGNFNGRVIESDVVGPRPYVVFSTEMVWETEKKMLRKARGSYARVRVDCYCTETHRFIGFALMCLRSAKIIVTGGGRMNQIDVQFTWTKLLNVSNEFRKGSPELNLALTIRDCIRFKPPTPTIYNMPSLPPQPLPQQLKVPAVYTSEGFIRLGDPRDIAECYQIKITIFTSQNMDVLLPEALVFNQNPRRYYLTFEIFGMAVRTRQLSRDLHNPMTFQERLVINLQSSYKTLCSYFKHYPEVNIKFFNDNMLLGCTIMKMNRLALDIEPEVFYQWNKTRTEMTQVCYFDSNQITSSASMYMRPASVGVAFELDLLNFINDDNKVDEVLKSGSAKALAMYRHRQKVAADAATSNLGRIEEISETPINSSRRQALCVDSGGNLVQIDDMSDMTKRFLEVSKALSSPKSRFAGLRRKPSVRRLEEVFNLSTSPSHVHSPPEGNISRSNEGASDMSPRYLDSPKSHSHAKASSTGTKKKPILRRFEETSPLSPIRPNSAERNKKKMQIEEISAMSKRLVEMSKSMTSGEVPFPSVRRKSKLRRIDELSESPIVTPRRRLALTLESETNQMCIDEITEMSERLLEMSRGLSSGDDTPFLAMKERHRRHENSGLSSVSLVDNRTNTSSLTTIDTHELKDMVYDTYHQFCLDIILDAIFWKYPPKTNNFILRFIHPKVSTYLEIALDIEGSSHKRILLENAICKLMFISSKQRLNYLLTNYCPKMELRNAKTDHLIADMVTLYCAKVGCERPESSYVIALKNHTGAVVADVNVSLFLEEFEPTTETSSSYDLMPHILDDAIVIQSLQELEAWKANKHMQFREHLATSKKKELKRLNDDWHVRKDELETSLQKNIDKCKKLSYNLKKNTHGLRIEKVVELRKRINDEYNFYFEIHKNLIRYSLSDNQELIEKISELEITVSIMRDLLSDQCMHIEEMKKTQLTGDQTKILLRDLKYMEQKYEIAQRDKNYFKTEYEKAVKEVHELKMEDHRNLATKIASDREALSLINADSFVTCVTTFEDDSSIRDDDTIADFNLDDISEPSWCDL